MGNICYPKRNEVFRYKRTEADVKDLKRTYNIDQIGLGKGSFGNVFKATNKQDPNHQIAVKVINKYELTVEEVESVHNEVKLMYLMDHPNIVNYYETYDDKKYIYLCMELCSGGELLENLIKKNKGKNLTEKSVSTVIYQLLVALNYIHKNNIIHRDIKPENIMYDKSGPDGIVKLIDFGLALQTKNRKEIDMAGTPYYMSPEMINDSYGVQTDIWSLGVVLYQLMTGNLPFNGNTQAQLYKNILKKDLIMPDHFSEDLKDLISRMLNKSPKKRITVKQAMKHPWIISQKKEIVIDDVEQQECLNRLMAFSGQSKLKRAAIQMIIKSQYESTHESLRNIFNKMDLNQTGTITHEELSKALKDQKLTDKQIKNIIQECDYAQNKQINYTEFLSATVNPTTYLNTARLQGVFNQFDVDNTGQISIQNLRLTFSKFGREITDEEIQQCLKHDKNNQNEIDFEEFRIMITGE